MEGKGDAVITDVVYSTKDSLVEQSSPSGSKEEHTAIQVSRTVLSLYPGSGSKNESLVSADCN